MDQNTKERMKNLRLPIIIALSVVLGILIGNFYALNATKGVMSMNHKAIDNSDKLSYLLKSIDALYVDSVNVDSIVEGVIPVILEQLDPHSSYIPAKDLQAVNDELGGSFSGIGIQFNIQKDTIYVVDVISGSPAEQVGMMAGDRIVTVNDSTFVGKMLNNEKVFNTLRGKKGSLIKIGVKRRNGDKVLNFNVIRGDIPLKSVDVAYMIEPGVGFIGVNKFGATTYQEFLTGIAELKRSGAQKLIVDLRGNSGGYMDAAIQMLNEFLAKDDLIVYMEGKSIPRTESRANGTGSFQDIDLVVLIDEWSGSASEIFAGAIQDNDRGVIIGRRSFGKGLVQQQRDFADHSAMRLTVARYYTPAGRCIQKPYKRGENLAYAEDILNRYIHGEFYSADSIHQLDTVSYLTKNGRKVYGGGGIMPDVFVPRDTTLMTSYFYNLVDNGLIYQFAIQYTDAHREKLKEYTDWRALKEYLEKQNLYPALEAYAASNNVTGPNSQKMKSKPIIMDRLYAYIIRNILGDNGFFPLLNNSDKTVERALKEINS